MRLRFRFNAKGPVISDDPKHALRRRAAETRDRAHAERGAEAALALALHGAGFIAAQGPGIVSGFWPMRGEIDVRPLLGRLHEAGRRLALPVVAAKDRPLLFRAWAPGDDLAKGAFGTEAPGAAAETLVPDILLVPLLAFDRAHHRLGYGGGFYDRTLAALRPVKPVFAIGVAYAAQEVDAIPTHAWDERLDAILTERGVV